MDRIVTRSVDLCKIVGAMARLHNIVHTLNDADVGRYLIIKKGRVVGILLDLEAYAALVDKNDR